MEAHSFYHESLTIFQEHGDRRGVGWALYHLAEVAYRSGDLAEAGDSYRRSLAVFTEIADGAGAGVCLLQLGDIERLAGHQEQAETLLCESLKIFRALKDQPGCIRSLERLAIVATQRGEPERALSLAGATAALRERAGLPRPPAEDDEIGAYLEEARAALHGPAETTAWSRGADMSLEQATEYGLERESHE